LLANKGKCLDAEGMKHLSDGCIEGEHHSHWIEYFLYAREWLNYCTILLTLCRISAHSQQGGRWRSEILEWITEG